MALRKEKSKSIYKWIYAKVISENGKTYYRKINPNTIDKIEASYYREMNIFSHELSDLGSSIKLTRTNYTHGKQDIHIASMRLE